MAGTRKALFLLAVSLAVFQVALSSDVVDDVPDTTQETTTVEEVVVTEKARGGVALEASAADSADTEYADAGAQTPVVVGAVAGLIALVAVFVGLLMRNKNRTQTPTVTKPQVDIEQNTNDAAQPPPKRVEEFAHATLRNTWINSGKGTPTVKKTANTDFDVTVVDTPQNMVKDLKNALSARKVTFENDQEENMENVETPQGSTLRRADGEVPPTQPRRGMASKLINKFEKEPMDEIVAAETPIAATNDSVNDKQETPFKRNPPVYNITGVDETSTPTEPEMKSVQEADDFEAEPRANKMINAKLSRRNAREQSLDYSSADDYSANFSETQMTPAQWEAQQLQRDQQMKNAGKLRRREMRQQSVDANVQDPSVIEVDPADEQEFNTAEQLREVDEANEDEDEEKVEADLPRPKFLSRRHAREQSENITPMSNFVSDNQLTDEQVANSDHTRAESRFMRLAARRLSVDESDEIEPMPAVEPLSADEEEEEQFNLFTKLLRRPALPDEAESDDEAWDLQALMNLAEPEFREFQLKEATEVDLKLWSTPIVQWFQQQHMSDSNVHTNTKHQT